MNPLAFLGAYRLAIEMVLLGVLTSALGAQTWRLHSSEAQRAVEQTEHLKQVLRASETHDAEQLKQREEGDRRVAEKERTIEDAQRKVSALETDAAIAAAASGRLSQRIAALVASAREARGHPEAAAPGAPAEDALGVFADVLGRCSARVRLLASYADAARVAGETCEHSYDSLTPP